MPHDCKGRLIEVGDVVRGKGYNVKHEIVGPVVSVQPGTSCNITVAHATMLKVNPQFAVSAAGHVIGTSDGAVRGLAIVQVGIEYGQTDAFEIVRKHDGIIPVDAAEAATAA